MSAHVPDDSSNEPQATGIEQCPNCAIVLVWDDKGYHCVVCGFPRSEMPPTRQPELADYIEHLRRNEDGAVARKPMPERESTPLSPKPGIAPPEEPKRQPADRSRTWPTSNADRQKDAEEDRPSSSAIAVNQAVVDTVAEDDLELLRRAQRALRAHWGYFLILIVGFLICIYLFRPWISAYASQVPTMPPENPVLGEEGNIDLYLLRDASGSPNVYQYDVIERLILSHVKLSDGDRMSYARFGGKDDPLDIQTPSKRWESIAAHMVSSSDRRGGFARTDFSNLFSHLRATIAREREEKGSQREHIDIVLILTDGVHDPDKTDWRCPRQFRENRKPFIPGEVRLSLEKLVRDSYARKERLLVAMVIAGEEVGCAPDIRSEWEHAKFAGLGLKVIPFHALKDDYDIGLSIFKEIRRSRCLYIRPTYARLDDQERNEFDRLAKFSAQYKYWSHAGGEAPASASRAITVKEAILFPGKKSDRFLDHSLEDEAGAIGRLLVVDSEDADPRFEFEAPAAGKRQGEIRPKTLKFFFSPSRPLKVKLRPEERYRIKLVFEEASLDVEADELVLDISATTTRRAELRKKLRVVSHLLLGIAIFFCTSFFLCIVIPPPSSVVDDPAG